MIHLQNVTKRFGDRVAVEGLTLSVQRGEMLGLLGPNGAGKTTTLRIITGFLPPTDGLVTVDGLDVFEHPLEVKQKIGYLPEIPPLYADLTAAECLTFVAETHGLRGKEARRALQHVAELCGITDMLGRLTGTLSKGYRQRVGLAQALIHDPEILVLDEPTAGLDPRQIIEIRRLIKGLGEDRTVILSSHILSEVTNICRKVAIMNNGRLAAIDTIETLSGRLRRGRRIRLRMVRPDQMDPGRLAAVAGVSSVDRRANGEVVLEVWGSDRTLEEIAAAVVAAGAGLVEMREEAMTLEDIFLSVVSGEAVS